MNEKITSLCFVSKRNDTSVELCRIADLIGGSFVPYEYDPAVKFSDTNRDLLFYNKPSLVPGDINTINVYDWDVYWDGTQERINLQKSKSGWIEVIRTDYFDPEDIIDAITEGWKINNFFDKQHDLIFVCQGVSPDHTIGIYTPKEILQIQGEVLTFTDDAAHINIGEINMGAVITVTCRYSRYDRRLYLKTLNAWHPTNSMMAKPIDDILNVLVQSEISKIGDGFGRRDRQKAKAALEKALSPGLLEKIKGKLHCSDALAQQYLDEYLKNTQIKLEAPDLQHVLDEIVEGNSIYTQSLRSKIEEEWRIANQLLISEAEKNANKLSETIVELKAQIAASEDKLAQVTAATKREREKTEELQILQNNIQSEINGRLQRIKEDHAAALVDFTWLQSMAPPSYPPTAQAFLSSAQPSSTSLDSTSIYSSRITQAESEEPEEDSVDEAWKESIEVWNDITMNRDIAKQLSLVSFAAWKCRQPLIICGDLSGKIADIISTSITGRKCVHIWGAEDINVSAAEAKIKSMHSDFLCFRNGLGPGYENVRELMELFPDSLSIITVRHEESLAMEPKSLFNTFIPIFTDRFIACDQIQSFSAVDCRKDFTRRFSQELSGKNIKSLSARQNGWRMELLPSPIMKRRVEQMHFAMVLAAQRALGKDTLGSRTAFQFLVLPILKALGRREEITDKTIDSMPFFPNEDKEEIKSFLHAGD